MPHNRALNGLRFAAFLFVFLFHALQRSPWANWPIIRFGFLGVPVFFVLSGFLIGGILLDLKAEKRTRLGSKLARFYLRRALRIFPVYYLFIALLALPMFLAGWPDKVAHDCLPWHLGYLTNVRSFVLGMEQVREGHFWSLAVEEHFYLLAPIVVLLVSPRALVRILVGVVAAVALARYAVYRAGSARDFWVLSPMQFDLLGLGIATAIIDRTGSFLGMTAGRLRALGLFAVLFFALYLRRFYLGRPGIGVAYATLGPLALGLATAALVLTLWQEPQRWYARVLALPPLAYLGQISYGLYLFHPNCLAWSSRYFGTYTITNTLVGLVITLAVAALSWHGFEKPINNLKHRFGYRGERDRPARVSPAVAPEVVAWSEIRRTSGPRPLAAARLATRDKGSRAGI
ncbi:MAG: acyltransferase [Polyangia bacterium]